jgi:monooxygenase
MHHRYTCLEGARRATDSDDDEHTLPRMHLDPAHKSVEHVDVLIVGAGLSGIGAGYHVQVGCPDKTYAIPEARDAIGGTWDLFRYPGIRSDSDMYTLGLRVQAVGRGPGDRRRILDPELRSRDRRRVRYRPEDPRPPSGPAADWSTPDVRWTVEARRRTLCA